MDLHSSLMFEFPKDGIIPLSVGTQYPECLVQLTTHLLSQSKNP